MNLHLRTRFGIIAFLIGLQIITLIGILNATSRHAEAVMLDHAESVMDHVATVVADNTKRFLEPAERSVHLTQLLIRDSVLDNQNDSQLERYFLRQLKANKHLASIYLGRNDGSFVFVKREKDGFRTKFIRTREGEREVELIFRDINFTEYLRKSDGKDDYDPRVRPWFQLAKTTDNLVWTQPYLFVTAQRPGSTAALQSYTSSGDEIGVIGADIEIIGLSNFLDDIPIGRQGKALIQDERGVVVAYPNIAKMLAQKGGDVLLRIEDLASPSFEALEAKGFSEDAFEKFDYAGEAHYAFVHPINLGDRVWKIVVQAPAEDFIGGLKSRHRQSLVEIFTFFTFLVVLALPLALGVTKPFVLHQRATIDSLTGIMNRAEFIRQSEVLRRRAERKNSDLAVVMFDIDGFKPINDSHGHFVGDEVLTRIAERLGNAVRQGDLIGRYGGDEFVMLLQDVPSQSIKEAVIRVQSVMKKPIKSSVGLLTIGVTGGVAMCDYTAHANIEKTLEEADDALLQGKRYKKGSIYVSTEECQVPYVTTIKPYLKASRNS